MGGEESHMDDIIVKLMSKHGMQMRASAVKVLAWSGGFNLSGATRWWTRGLVGALSLCHLLLHHTPRGTSVCSWLCAAKEDLFWVPHTIHVWYIYLKAISTLS